ncbi:hypothetical protein [Hyphococcus luteus]|uniref:Uncharacterized protein n=1 Tax=Hyphococcus luteus TaxID=2058213 RepID=A0A2S7K3U6_9PROT|nr:hypothetical protein [Marinicaulis flavus]PQA87180.1 hypothetical protein CW354_14165 [Marinicaulis flavus]
MRFIWFIAATKKRQAALRLMAEVIVMSDKSRKSSRPRGRERRKPGAYKPSKEFLKYLTLVQACQTAADEVEFAKTNAEREKITREIARRHSNTVSEIFEKIYVWRMESFDPDEAGEICYDDMFPLSVYYDLKRLSNFEGAPADADAQYEDHLRSDREDAEAETEGGLEEIYAHLFPKGSFKLH